MSEFTKGKVYADHTRIVPVERTASIATTNCGNHTHNNEANAARLAHCWNHFEDYETALKEIIAQCPDPGLPYGIAVVEIAHQALSKAKGDQ